MEVQALYEQVDELLHRLVSLNNLRSNQLTSIRSFRRLEEGFTQVQAWLQDVGEPRLKRLSEAEDSLEMLRKKQREFKEFHSTAYDWSRQGSSLLAQMERWVEERSCDQGSADQGSGDPWSADLQQCEVRVQRFWSELQDFSERVRTAGQNLEREGRLSSFLDQAYGWALQGMRHLAGVRMEDCKLPDKCQAVIGCLEEYRLQHPPLPDAHFQEMREEAGHLRGGRGLQQWSFAWSKCQETKGVFDRKLEAALRSRSYDSAHKREYDSSHYSEAPDSAHNRSSDSSHKQLSGSVHNRSSDSSHYSKESDSAHNRSSDSSNKQLSGSVHNRSSDSSHYSKESDSAHNRSSDSSHYSKESDSAHNRSSDSAHNQKSGSIHNRSSDSAHNQKSGSIHNRSSAPFRRTLSALWGVQEKMEDSVSSPSLSSSSSSSLQPLPHFVTPPPPHFVTPPPPRPPPSTSPSCSVCFAAPPQTIQLFPPPPPPLPLPPSSPGGSP
ncbi:hypothetical protein NQZ68_038831 [Dissostichus eleginoides]|nr:hypothetical protein NQZ68_038831 [Dissostichus eleginoides]